MGRTNSQPRQNRLGLDYAVLASEGSTVHLVNNDNQQALVLRTASDASAQLPWVRALLTRAHALDHGHVSPVIDFELNQDGSLSVLAATPQRTLQDERDERVFEGVPFQVNELWSILASLILGFAYLERNGIAYGAVRVSNINVEESGLIRIAHPLLVLEQSNFLQSRAGTMKEDLYLSPKQLECVKAGQAAFSHNQFKSDVFTLGVVTLDLATLTSMKDLYNGPQPVNLSYLRQVLRDVEAKYGKEFASIMELMTEPDEQRRLDWVQLEEFMKKVDNQPAPAFPPPEFAQVESKQQTPTNSQHGYQVRSQMSPAAYYQPPQMVRQLETVHQRKPSSQSTNRVYEQYYIPTGPSGGLSQVVYISPLVQSISTTAGRKNFSSPEHQQAHLSQYPTRSQAQFLNRNMIHYQQKGTPSQPTQQHKGPSGAHQRLATNILHQQSPQAKIAPVFTDNHSMRQSHHFGMGSQHLVQTRQLGAPQAYTPDHKYQHPPHQQALRMDQPTPAIPSIANNRIVASNINREKSLGKSPAPAQQHQQTQQLQSSQTKLPPFAKKANSLTEQRPVTLPQQPQLQKMNQVVPPPHVSFSFQSHTHPTRVMTAETKKFIQKDAAQADKHTPVDAFAQHVKQEDHAISQKPIKTEGDKINLEHLFEEAPATIPLPPRPEVPAVTSKVVSTPPASAIQQSNFYQYSTSSNPGQSHFSSYMSKLQGTSSGVIENTFQSQPIVLPNLPNILPSQQMLAQIQGERGTGTQDPLPFAQGAVIDYQPNLQLNSLFNQQEEKQSEPDSKGVVGQSQMSIIQRERKNLMDDGDRFGRTEELKFDESYGYSQSNIKPYDSELNRWPEHKFEDKASDKAKPSTVKLTGFGGSDLYKEQNLGYNEAKVSVEVQTTANVSEVKKSAQSAVARQAGTRSYYEDKQVSTSTLRGNTPPKNQETLPSPRRVQPKYEGSTLKGFRHGKGKYTFEDGSYYEGNWNFNRMQGYGKLFYASGKIAYEGGWSQDQIHGSGKLYNEHPRPCETVDYKNFSKSEHSWRSYEGIRWYDSGNFEFDQRSGNGTLTFENGESFTGQFEGDHIHGEGVFNGRNRTVHGLWQHDQLKSLF